jgi:HEPN domain-containing protein
MTKRANDWLKQAGRDLEQARDSLASKRYEWVCFAAHQGAEKAVKAVHLSLAQEAWGHVVRRLLEDLPGHIVVSSEMLDKARVMDSYYIPTRYPNGHDEGAPFEHYGALQAEEALLYASEIIEFCRAQMAG